MKILHPVLIGVAMLFGAGAAYSHQLGTQSCPIKEGFYQSEDSAFEGGQVKCEQLGPYLYVIADLGECRFNFFKTPELGDNVWYDPHGFAWCNSAHLYVESDNLVRVTFDYRNADVRFHLEE
jgi:hypothetical protein